jgi:hypothetical protein
MENLNRNNFQAAIRDLEDARLYLPAGDPRQGEIEQALEQARRRALTPAAVTNLVTPLPSGAAPDVALGERLFGRVYLASVPLVAGVPAPATTFGANEQVALYLERLAQGAEFRLRVFGEHGEFLGTVGTQAGSPPPVRWSNSLVWYQQGPERPGAYRAELYSGATLTNVLNFVVREQIAQASSPRLPSPLPAPSPTRSPSPTSPPTPPPPTPTRPPSTPP